MTVTHTQIQRLLLVFWAIWFGFVAATNVGDALVAAGMLRPDWPFASGNFGQIKEVTSRYATPSWLLPPLFAGVMLWETLSCALFVRAWASTTDWRAAARLAYAVSLALWATFMIVDEIFIAYEVAGTHLRLLIAEVACLIYLLLDERAT